MQDISGYNRKGLEDLRAVTYTKLPYRVLSNRLYCDHKENRSARTYTLIRCDVLMLQSLLHCLCSAIFLQ